MCVTILSVGVRLIFFVECFLLHPIKCQGSAVFAACVATSSFVLRSASAFAHWCNWSLAEVICLLIRSHAEGAPSEVLCQKKGTSNSSLVVYCVCNVCSQATFLPCTSPKDDPCRGDLRFTLHSLLSHELASCRLWHLPMILILVFQWTCCPPVKTLSILLSRKSIAAFACTHFPNSIKTSDD